MLVNFILLLLIDFILLKIKGFYVVNNERAHGQTQYYGLLPELNGHEIGSYFEGRDKEFGLTVHEGSPALMINRNI